MIIDDKGRLFGKINIIDFIVLLFLMGLIPMGYFGYKIANTKKPVVEQKLVKLEVEVRFSRVMPELARNLTEGDVEKDASGKTIGTLRKIISKSSSQIISVDTVNKSLVTVDSDYRELVALFELVCAEESRVYYYGSYPIKIGNHVTFATDLYSIQGVVIDINK